MRGYQFGSPDGFYCTIDRPYVDGVSITHGASPKKHIWTYAAGLYEYNTVGYDCPCTGGGPSPPSFVGSDYYCESGFSAGDWQAIFYPNDSLWDGQYRRGLERTCCDPPNLPWELPESTTDDLEVCICGDFILSNKDTPIDLVQLYIQ